MRLFERWVEFDRLLIGRDSLGEVLPLRIENAQLQIPKAQPGIEVHGFLQKGLNLRQRFAVFWALPDSLKTDRVVIVGHCIFSLKREKSPKPLYQRVSLCLLNALDFAQKQVRAGVVGIQVRRLAKTLDSRFVGTASVPRRSEADQHSDGMRKQVISLGEDFNGRFQGTMHQQ